MFWLYPIYAFLFEHKRELMFGIRMPFVDHKTLKGYTSIMSMQLIFEIYAVMGIACNDTISMMLFFHIIAFNGLLRVDLHEFGEFLREDDPNERHKVKEKLNNIVSSHQEIIE